MHNAALTTRCPTTTEDISSFRSSSGIPIADHYLPYHHAYRQCLPLYDLPQPTYHQRAFPPTDKHHLRNVGRPAVAARLPLPFVKRAEVCKSWW